MALQVSFPSMSISRPTRNIRRRMSALRTWRGGNSLRDDGLEQVMIDGPVGEGLHIHALLGQFGISVRIEHFGPPPRTPRAQSSNASFETARSVNSMPGKPSPLK